MTNDSVYENYKFFSFISDESHNLSFTMKLGNYISHEVVGKNCNTKELDALDRTYCAEIFLDKNRTYFNMYNKSVYNAYIITPLYDKLKEEIAWYIDLKIPYFYYIKKNKISNQDGRKYYKGIALIGGELNYKFKQSIILEKSLFKINLEMEMPTIKQKKYLHDLAKDSGYKVINENKITREIVAKLIGFIKDDEDLELELQKKFLIYE